MQCPYRQERVSELWDGPLPIVPANTYLRAAMNAKVQTLEAKAYRLVVFFRYLKANGWSFWDEDVRRGGAKMLFFRNALLARARRPQGDPAKITHVTARLIMDEVFQLCEWWRQSGEDSLVSGVVIENGRGNLPHLDRQRHKLPDAFVVRVPTAERYRLNDVLLLEEVEAVWSYLTIEAMPRAPALVRKHPRPLAAWSPAKRGQWERGRAKFAERLAWHRRHLLLWAIFIGGAMRLDEVPLLMVHDLGLHNGRELWLSLRERHVTQDLGKAKTGGRLVFIGWDQRVVTAWTNWMRDRQTLVDRWMRRTGQPDHRMLLVNRDGGPLTADGVDSLFDRLNERFGVFGQEHASDNGFALHAHAIRHTVEAAFASWGVPIDVIQRHFGHKRVTTTMKYGKVYRRDYVQVLREIDARHTAAASGTP